MDLRFHFPDNLRLVTCPRSPSRWETHLLNISQIPSWRNKKGLYFQNMFLWVSWFLCLSNQTLRKASVVMTNVPCWGTYHYWAMDTNSLGPSVLWLRLRHHQERRGHLLACNHGWKAQGHCSLSPTWASPCGAHIYLEIQEEVSVGCPFLQISRLQ